MWISKAAYDWLRKHNDLYATVAWNDEAAAGLRKQDVLGLPAQLSACVYRQDASGACNTRQEGPADAVADGDRVDLMQASRGRLWIVFILFLLLLLVLVFY